VITSRPAFTWTLDEGQDTIAVRVSSSSTLGDDGVLKYPEGSNSTFVSYYPDVAEGESLSTFRPKITQGLPAGTYYWQLQVYDYDQSYISPVQSFTVPKRTVLRTLSATGKAGIQRLTIKLGHVVNASKINYRLDVMQGRTRIGRPITGTFYNSSKIGSPAVETFAFKPIGFKLKRGERYTIKARITANGITRSRTKVMTVGR
jgi:hypothetical protein